MGLKNGRLGEIIHWIETCCLCRIRSDQCFGLIFFNFFTIFWERTASAASPMPLASEMLLLITVEAVTLLDNAHTWFSVSNFLIRVVWNTDGILVLAMTATLSGTELKAVVQLKYFRRFSRTCSRTLTALSQASCIHFKTPSQPNLLSIHYMHLSPDISIWTPFYHNTMYSINFHVYSILFQSLWGLLPSLSQFTVPLSAVRSGHVNYFPVPTKQFWKPMILMLSTLLTPPSSL